MERLEVKSNERIIKQINNNLLKIIFQSVGTEVSLTTLVKVNKKFKNFVELLNEDQLNLFKQYKNRL